VTATRCRSSPPAAITPPGYPSPPADVAGLLDCLDAELAALRRRVRAGDAVSEERLLRCQTLGELVRLRLFGTGQDAEGSQGPRGGLPR